MINNEQQVVINQALSILDDELRQTDMPLSSVNSHEDAKNYVRLLLEQQEREVFAVMYLNTHYQLIECKELFYGTVDNSRVYPREVVKLALLNNATGIILVHNHPAGGNKESRADIKLSEHIGQCASLFDIELIDHLIVCKGEVVSLVEQGVITKS